MRERFTHSVNSKTTSGLWAYHKYFLSLLLVFLSIILYSQPANDNCGSATALPTDGTCQSFTTVAATNDIANGSCTAGSINVWFSFVAQGSTYDIQASSGTGGFQPELTLIEFSPTPCDFASATQIDCGATAINGGSLTPGNTYYVILTSATDTEAAFDICLNNPPPPPNDDPCTATSIPNLNGSCTPGTTDFANDDFVIPGCANIDNQVFYAVNLSGINSILDLTIANPTITGNLYLDLFSASSCTAPFTSVATASYCGPAGAATLNATGLTPGVTYYILVGSTSAGQGDFDICATEAAPPPNDDQCTPDILNPNGTCVSGTTTLATSDFNDPFCGAVNGGNSVFYQVTLGVGQNALNINLTSLGLSGTISVMLKEVNGNCATTPGTIPSGGNYCGSPAGANFDVTGLTAGTTYIIQVTSTSAGEGDFDICVTESGPDPACIDNEDCNNAVPLTDPFGGSPTCITGECNDGAAPGNLTLPCATLSNSTVWYSYTAPATTTSVNFSIANATFTNPIIGVLTGCGVGATVLACQTGAAGTVQVSNIPVIPGTTYYIAVSGTGTSGGTFDICTESFGPGTTCVNNNLSVTVQSTSLGSPFNGPFQPGETVEYCININGWTQSAINWIHGIVPEFGDCWDPASFAPNGMPLNVTVPLTASGSSNPTWSWWADGQVTYNNIPSPYYPAGTAVGAGWFTTNVAGGTCGSNSTPNCSWGDSGNGPWQVCFELTTRSFPQCASFGDCAISVKTFADSETGDYSAAGCSGDAPIINNTFLNCCDGPDVTLNPVTICSGDQASVILNSDQPGTTFTWSVNSTPVTGASDCNFGCGTVISQILTNPTNTPQVVTYTVFSVNSSGCFGASQTVDVTVQPDVQVSFNPSTLPIICEGSSVQLNPIINPPGSYTYQWNVPGVNGPNPTVSPTTTTTYELTLIDQFGCSTTPAQVTVTVAENLFVDISTSTGGTEICTNDSGYPMILNASVLIGGTGNYTYNWAPVSATSSSIPVTASGTYLVTVTDINTNCEGTASIDITVNTPPIGFLINLGDFCENTYDTLLQVIPNGGTWTGDVDPFGNVYPNILGPGSYSVTYTFTDPSTLCTNQITETFEVFAGSDIDPISDITACEQFTLPVISGSGLSGSEAYYDSPGGTGSVYSVGDVISNSITLYAYDSNGGCADEEEFIITIVPQPQVNDLVDGTYCNDYTLPAITGINLTGNESYYTGPGGTGVSLSPGDVITTTTTLYIYDGVAGCDSEEEVTITINVQPQVDDLADGTYCNDYTLPAITGTDLTGNESYYTGPGGTGTSYNAGDVITTTTTLYIYDGVAGCDSEEEVTITINVQPQVDDLADGTYCNDYTLPAITGTDLTGNEAYYTGPGGTGTSYNTGEVITTTTTLYIYDGVAGCDSEEEVTITINLQPQVNDLVDGTYCNDYTLPVITGADLTGNESYYTGPGGTGTSLSAGDVITTTTTLYIYDGVAGCDSEEEVTITINVQPQVNDLADGTYCNDYTLPAITGTDLTGNEAYYTGPGGTGTSYNAGDVITTTTTLYIYDGVAGCDSEEEVTITINVQPQVDDLADGTYCNDYTLPAITGTDLTGNESYYTGPGGTGTSLSAGDVITTTTTLYIYDGVAGCDSEEEVTITINVQPQVNDLVDGTYCNDYTLPAITGTDLTGNEAYYTGPGGTGTSYNAGEVITATTTLYIYDGIAGCDSEEEVTITINVQPQVNDLADGTYCNDYTLPAITGTDLTGNEAYYTGPGGTGTSYNAGDVINATTTLYIYDGVAGCDSEEEVTITINVQPQVNDLADGTYCNDYTLPAITGTDLTGNEAYYTGPGGTGTSYNAGDVITTTTTLYIYDGVAGCDSEEEVTITINVQPQVNDLADGTYCNDYTLPAITGTDLTGNEAYYTGPGGTGTSYNAGDVITATTTLYIYDGVAGCNSEEEVTITIILQPQVNDLADGTFCNDYTLPAITGTDLTGNEAYYTGPGGTGTSFSAGDVINTTTTLYIYDGVAGCDSEEEVTITINVQPQVDDLADGTYCNDYTLPAITGTDLTGNEAYYTGSNGTGTSFNAGEVISSTTTLYLYDGIAGCDSEEEVTITIVQASDILPPAPVEVCDSYTLPNITGSNLSSSVGYYSGPGGTGTAYAVGEIITSSATIYLFDPGTVNGCGDEETLDVQINSTPTSDFSVDSPICVTETSTVTYLGTATSNATFNWSFGGATVLSGSGSGPYELEWASSGNYNISLTVEENGCQSTTTSQMVMVEAPLPTPVINCAPTTTTITFSWGDIPNASSYIVTVNTGQPGSMVGPTSYEVTGLSPNETVQITVEAIGTNSCGNSSSTFSCDAIDCPTITIDVDAVNDICLDGNNSTINLNATITGGAGTGTGTWSGPGIIDPINGVFDPADVSVNTGSNTIIYSYEESSCNYVGNTDIFVFQQPLSTFNVNPVLCLGDTIFVEYTGNATTAATYDWDFGNATVHSGSGPGPYELTWNSGTSDILSLTVTENGCTSSTTTEAVTIDQPLAAPVVNCSSSTSQIEFTWTDVPGATGYDVILVEGPAGVQSGNSYLVTGLNPGDSVTVTIVAISGNACPSSTSTATCYATDCPSITLDLNSPQDSICLDGNAAAFNLTAVVNGGAGTGTGTWSGPGIIDAANGTFDPEATSVSLGENIITYTYEESGCPYSATVSVYVFDLPDADFSVTQPICIGDIAIVEYTGSNGLGADYDWDFGNATVLSGSGQGPYELTWSSGASDVISLTVTENGCSTTSTQTITIDQPLADPVVNCSSSTSQIEFTWTDVPGATGYDVILVDGPTGVQSGNSYLVTGLNPGDSVTVTIVAISGNACPSSTSTMTCYATDCPSITLDLSSPQDSICLDGNADAFDLTAVVNGGAGTGTGTWSGPGIIDAATGTFDPEATSVNLGENIITYTYVESGCPYSATVSVYVFDLPGADFSVTQPICVGDIAIVEYTGTSGVGADYDWDFGSATVLSGSGQGPYELTWSSGASDVISLTVTENGCSATTTQTITLDQPLADPVVNCSSSTSQIEFTWNDVPGATGYDVILVDGPTGVQSGNSYLITGLNPNDSVTITVVAISGNACPSSSSTATCYATDCPSITLDLDSPQDSICLDGNADAFDLIAVVNGGAGTGTGTWSGPGIIGATTGTFDPEATSVNLGENVITYTYVESGCPYSATVSVYVFDLPGADFSVTQPICVGDIAIVEYTGTSGVGADYDWDFGSATVLSGSGQGPYELTWSSGASDVISLTVTENSCSATTTQTITIDQPLADPIINCSSSTSQIEFTWDDVPGATGYDVILVDGPTGVQNGNSYLVTGLSPGDSVTLTVVAISGNACPSSSSTTTCFATDCPSITLDLNAPETTICLDDSDLAFDLSVTITGSDGSGTGQWIGNGITDAVNGTFDPAQISQYGVATVITYSFEEAGCTYSNFIEITVNETPEISNLQGGEITCTDTDISLSAQTSATNSVVQWNGPGIISGANSLTPLVDIGGWYFISVEDQNTGCVSVDSVFVEEGDDIPQVFAGEGGMLTCTDTVVILEATGTTGADFQFVWNGPLDASQTNLANPVTSVPGIYTVVVENTVNGCISAPDSVIVQENVVEPLAIVTNPLDPINCEIQALSLIAEEVPNAEYFWYTENGTLLGTQSTLNVEAEGLYLLNVLDTLNGCLGIDSIEVEDNTSYPLIFIADPNDLTCSQEEVQLDASESSDISANMNIMVEWNGPNGGISGPLDEFTTTAILPGVYNLTLTDTINQCSNDTSIIVNQLDDAPLAISNNPDELNCSQEPVQLNGENSTGTGTLSFEWSYDGVILSQEVTVLASDVGTYQLVVIDAFNDCSDTTLVDIFESPNLLGGANVLISEPSCYGENDGLIFIDSVTGGTPNYEYSLNGTNFSGVNPIAGLNAGSYTLTIQDQESCTWDTTIVVPTPEELLLDLGDEVILQLGEDYTIDAQFNIPDGMIESLLWSPVEELICLDSLSEICRRVSAQPINNLLVQATLRDTNGCSVNDEILLRVRKDKLVFIPNVFSPNGDGSNEIFMINAGTGVRKVNQFFVYDRWGEIMYEGHDFLPNDPAYGWDGTLDGRPMNPAVFVYWAEVELEDGQVVLFEGDVTLYR